MARLISILPSCLNQPRQFLQTQHHSTLSRQSMPLSSKPKLRRVRYVAELQTSEDELQLLITLILSSGLTFDAIGKAIGRDEVWVASAFYGQVRILLAFSSTSRWLCPCLRAILYHALQAKPSAEELAKLSELLELPQAQLTAGLGDHWFPYRGLGTAVPTDPVVYRLYEVRRIQYLAFWDPLM